MRVLIVQSWYPDFLDGHYAERPELAGLSYQEQMDELMASGFGAGDAYSTYLRACGHEAEEIVVNCLPAQARWAEEQGLPLGSRLRRRIRRDWQELVTLAQVEAFAPDVVHVNLLSPLSRETLASVASQVRLLVGQIATFLPPEGHLDPYGLIVTSFPHYVTQLRAGGRACEYLRLGFDARIVDKLGKKDEHYGAVFVGGLGRSWHGAGNEVIERAAARVPIDFWGYGAESWPPDSDLRRRYHGQAWGLEMYRLLSQAAIGLNRHIDAAEGHANNLRLYDVTGVGTLLVTDAGSNLAELFEPGREVVTYRDEEDLVGKLRTYLADDDARREVAAAGQRRTLAEHSWEVRMREYSLLLERYAI